MVCCTRVCFSSQLIWAWLQSCRDYRSGQNCRRKSSFQNNNRDGAACVSSGMHPGRPESWCWCKAPWWHECQLGLKAFFLTSCPGFIPRKIGWADQVGATLSQLTPTLGNWWSSTQDEDVPQKSNLCSVRKDTYNTYRYLPLAAWLYWEQQCVLGVVTGGSISTTTKRTQCPLPKFMVSLPCSKNVLCSRKIFSSFIPSLDFVFSSWRQKLLSGLEYHGMQTMGFVNGRYECCIC